jgi:IQ motif/SEC7 domain-containing protein
MKEGMRLIKRIQAELRLLLKLDFLRHFTVAGEKPQRRGSVGSLDSGMSISFQSTSASSMSQGVKGAALAAGHQVLVHGVHAGAANPGGAKGAPVVQQPSFLGSLFNKRERKLSHTEDPTSMTLAAGMTSGAVAAPGQTVPYGRTTEV